MTKQLPLPPIDELRRMLAYRSDGVLIWKRNARVKLGSVAGTNTSNNYRRVTFGHRMYLVHRIIWGIVKREDPLGFDIDHINGSRSDNRIENLRKVSNSQNQQNAKRVKGYFYNSYKGKWEASIKLLDKRKYLGRFDTEEQAREAYLRAKEKLHGQFMPSEMKYELGHIDGTTSQLDLFND